MGLFDWLKRRKLPGYILGISLGLNVVNLEIQRNKSVEINTLNEVIVEINEKNQTELEELKLGTEEELEELKSEVQSLQ